MDRLGVVFMGTPDFAIPSLTALIGAGHRIVCAYTRAPRPAGRGQRARRSPVHALAEAEGVAVRCPARLRDAAEIESFAALGADVAVVVAYGLILPPAILAAPRLGCLNVHASLLPRWRGAAPIQRAILAGDAETGITIMKMDEGLDTGPTLARRTVAIGPRTDAGALHDALAEAGAALLVETLPAYAEGRLVPVAQPADGVTYAPKIERAETRIDWRLSAAELDCVVRAFSPAPGAWFEAAGTRIRVLEAAPVEAGAAPPGTVVGTGPVVACGAGALRLDRLQREGRAPMPAEAFLRGFALPPGTRLDPAGDDDG